MFLSGVISIVKVMFAHFITCHYRLVRHFKNNHITAHKIYFHLLRIFILKVYFDFYGCKKTISQMKKVIAQNIMGTH